MPARGSGTMSTYIQVLLCIQPCFNPFLLCLSVCLVNKYGRNERQLVHIRRICTCVLHSSRTLCLFSGGKDKIRHDANCADTVMYIRSSKRAYVGYCYCTQPEREAARNNPPTRSQVSLGGVPGHEHRSWCSGQPPWCCVLAHLYIAPTSNEATGRRRYPPSPPAPPRG